MQIGKTLYGKNKAGKLIQWEIFTEGANYYTIHGQVGKKLTQSLPTLAETTNGGRANERLPAEQALFEATAAYTKKVKEGYSEDIAKAGDKHYPDAMAAYNLKDYEDEVVYPAVAQVKYNGTRSLNNELGLWSREGEEWVSVPHIKADLASFFKEYPTAMADSEFFNYTLREKLNELVSIVRKNVDNTPEDFAKSEAMVRLVVYDGYLRYEDRNKPYSVRYAELIEALLKHCKYVDRVQQRIVNNREELIKFYEELLEEGHEGAMLRWGDTGYIFGRTKYLLKCKPFVSAEFVLLDVEPGVGNWAGAAKRLFFKRPSDGAEFKGAFKGNRTKAKKFLAEWEQYKGQLVTVEYTSLTAYGIPNYARLDYDNFLRADNPVDKE